MRSFESSKPVRSTSRVAALGKRPSLTHRCSDPEFSDSELDDAVDMGENAVWANLEKPIYTEKEIEVFRPTPEGSSLPIYYTKGWLPFSADTLFNTLMDIRYRKSWDTNVDAVHVVEHQHASDVMYFTFKLPWPLANRDYVYRRRVKFHPKQNAFVVLYHAAHHATAPAHEARVRVETCRLRLCIRNLSRTHDSCDFHLEYEDDTTFRLPNYLVTMLLHTMMPSFMTKLHKACKGYAQYFHTVTHNGAESMPSQSVRLRSEAPAEAIALKSETSDSTAKQNVLRTALTEERKTLRVRPHLRNGLFFRRKSKRSNPSSGREIVACSSGSEDDKDAPHRKLPTAYRPRRISFRHSMSVDARDHLRQPSPAHNLESQLVSIAAFSRASSVASTPLDKDKALKMLFKDEFVVTFHKQTIGLHLRTDRYSNHIFVAWCEMHSEAASSKEGIVPGLLVTSINGVGLSACQLNNMLSEIQRAPRPLTLGFGRPDRQAFLDYCRCADPHNVVQCLSSRENNVLSALSPFDEDSSTSAVLCHDFVAPAATACRTPATIMSGQIIATLYPSKSLPQADMDRVLVPAGYLVYAINGSFVLDVPFAEIAYLLQSSGNVCSVTFIAAMSIGGSKSRALKETHYRSKRFPDFFRKKRELNEATVAATNSLISSRELAYARHVSSEASQTKQSEDCDLMDYLTVPVTASNIKWVWRQVLTLRAKERIFSAAVLIDRLEAVLAQTESAQILAATRTRAKRAMEDQQELIDYIKERRDQGVKALQDLSDSSDDDTWQLGQTMLGVTTSWKPDNDGSIWIKLEGFVDGVDIFNTISVIREVDLYRVWAPFCSQSLLLQQMGHVELAAYLALSSPLLQRDAVVRAFGINALYEHRCLLLIGRSVDVSTLTSSMPVPTLHGWGAHRMEIKGFRALIEPLTRVQARTCIVAHLDLKCAVPRALLHFGLKHMAGMMLYLIRKEAEKMQLGQKRPTACALNEHLCRITNDPSGFYTWLRPIVDKYFRDQDDKKLPEPISLTLKEKLKDLNEICGTNNRRKSARIQSSPLQRRVSVLTTLSVAPQAFSTYHWSDYLYDFALWPYVLLYLFANMSADLPWLYACGLKLGFTCSCTWLAVPGAFSRATRRWKRLHHELAPLRRQFVVLAAVCDVLSSYAIGVWVHWFQCYVNAILYGTWTTTLCFARSRIEVRESEQLWIVLFCFIFASAMVGMQIRQHLIHLIKIP